MQSVRTAEELPRIVELVRGRLCDVSWAALDPDGGKFYVPVLHRAARRAPLPQALAGELIVGAVVELTIENAAGVRWFDLDALSYDARSGRLSIRSKRAIRFVLTVERLDVALRMPTSPLRSGPSPR